MPFPNNGAAPVVLDGEVISAAHGSEGLIIGNLSCARQPPRMHLQRLGRAVLGPLQQCDFQRSAEGEITFETFPTTSNVVFLMSYVSNTACGTFF